MNISADTHFSVGAGGRKVFRARLGETAADPAEPDGRPLSDAGPPQVNGLDELSHARSRRGR